MVPINNDTCIVQALIYMCLLTVMVPINNEPIYMCC